MKKFLSVLLSMLMILSVAPMSFAQEGTDDFLLATISDIHYYPESLAKFKSEAFYTYMKGSNAVYEDMNGILDSALAALEKDARENGLEYVVISGDLTTNGEYEGHAALSEKLKAFEERTGLNVLVTNGNHDINNPRASEFTTLGSYEKGNARMTTPSEFYEFYKDLGFDKAVATYAEDISEAAAQGLPGAFSYAVSVDSGYRLIMIDAGKYTALSTDSGEDKQETGGRITAELLAWILAQAKQAQQEGETPIAFTHWNISEMNYMHGEILSGFVLDDAYKLQEIFADNGIHFAFSGHQHVSDVDVTYSDAGEVMYSCIVPTLTQYPFMFRKTQFTRDASGNVSARYDQLPADIEKPVKSMDGTVYPFPYFLTTGCAKQMGDTMDAAGYLLNMVKNLLSGYISQIQYENSIVNFIKKQFGFDLREFLQGYLKDGFTFEGTDILTVNNIMYFVDDLDSQLRNLFLDNPSEDFWPMISRALNNIASLQVSDVPCTKYLGEDSYGFGDASKGGTLGDLFFTVLVNMYPGNEDISDDLFVQDVLSRCGTVEFADMIFNALKEYVVEDILIDEILGKLQVRIDTLYPNDTPDAVTFVRVLYTAVTAFISTELYKPESCEDFFEKLEKFGKLLGSVQAGSYATLIDVVLSTGVAKKYGTTTDELIEYLMNTFLGDAQRKAAAHQIFVVFDGIFNDEDKDHEVTYEYTGPVKVTPTIEDMQLPVNVNMSLGKEPQTSFNIKWMTKYSVTGTDIEITEKGKPFTGTPTLSGVSSKTESDVISGYGFDFGTFGIMNWSREVNIHSVSITGLKPATEYKYRIGDFAKGFVSEGTYTTANDDAAFAFAFVSNTAGVTPEMCERFGNTVKAASEKAPLSFIVHGGSAVLKGDTENQWSWALNGARNTLLNIPVQYTSGTGDIGDSSPVARHWSFTDIPKYAQSAYGVYYSFDYEHAHFTVLNINELDTDGTLLPGQLKWLKEDVSSTEKPWRILVLNSPIYGENSICPELATQLERIISENHISLVLTGSNGAYTSSYVTSKGSANPQAPVKLIKINGKTYTAYSQPKGYVAISGCSSNNFPESLAFEEALTKTAVSTDCPVFTVFNVEDEKMGITTYKLNPDGTTEVIDSLGIINSFERIIPADVTNDGVVTAADARFVLRVAVGLEQKTAMVLVAADLNGDNRITAADARIVLRIAVGLESVDKHPVYYFASDIKI